VLRFLPLAFSRQRPFLNTASCDEGAGEKFCVNRKTNA
jgi:hypothetical protein